MGTFPEPGPPVVVVGCAVRTRGQGDRSPAPAWARSPGRPENDRAMGFAGMARSYRKIRRFRHIRGHGPLLPKNRAVSVCSRAWVAPPSPVPTEMVGTCGWSGPCPRNNRIKPKSHSSTDTPPSVAPTRPEADWPAHTGRPCAHPPRRAGHDRETPAATTGRVCP